LVDLRYFFRPDEYEWFAPHFRSEQTGQNVMGEYRYIGPDEVVASLRKAGVRCLVRDDTVVIPLDHGGQRPLSITMLPGRDEEAHGKSSGSPALLLPLVTAISFSSLVNAASVVEILAAVAPVVLLALSLLALTPGSRKDYASDGAGIVAVVVRLIWGRILGGWRPVAVRDDELLRRHNLARKFLSDNLDHPDQGILEGVVSLRGPPRFNQPSCMLTNPFTGARYVFLREGASYREITHELIAALGNRSHEEVNALHKELAIQGLKVKASRNFQLLRQHQDQYRTAWEATQQLITCEGVGQVLAKIFNPAARPSEEFLGELVAAASIEKNIPGSEIIELSMDRFGNPVRNRRYEVDSLLRLNKKYRVATERLVMVNGHPEYRQTTRVLKPGDYLVESKTDEVSIDLTRTIQAAQDEKMDKYRHVARAMLRRGYKIRGFVFAMSGDLIPENGYNQFHAFVEETADTIKYRPRGSRKKRRVAPLEILVAYIPDAVLEKDEHALDVKRRDFIKKLFAEIRHLWDHGEIVGELSERFVRWQHILAAITSARGRMGTQTAIADARGGTSLTRMPWGADEETKRRVRREDWERVFLRLEETHGDMVDTYVAEHNLDEAISGEDDGPEFDHPYQVLNSRNAEHFRIRKVHSLPRRHRALVGNCLVQELARVNKIPTEEVLLELINAGLPLGKFGVVQGLAIDFTTFLNVIQDTALYLKTIRFSRKSDTLWHASSTEGEPLHIINSQIKPTDYVGASEMDNIELAVDDMLRPDSGQEFVLIDDLQTWWRLQEHLVQRPAGCKIANLESFIEQGPHVLGRAIDINVFCAGEWFRYSRRKGAQSEFTQEGFRAAIRKARMSSPSRKVRIFMFVPKSIPYGSS